VHTVAAGRTDTGVHAAAQVVHFDAAGPIPPQRWAKALNVQQDVRPITVLDIQLPSFDVNASYIVQNNK
jgi:tRNA pseudouridine(38-40) synthase